MEQLLPLHIQISIIFILQQNASLVIHILRYPKNIVFHTGINPRKIQKKIQEESKKNPNEMQIETRRKCINSGLIL